MAVDAGSGSSRYDGLNELLRSLLGSRFMEASSARDTAVLNLFRLHVANGEQQQVDPQVAQTAEQAGLADVYAGLVSPAGATEAGHNRDNPNMSNTYTFSRDIEFGGGTTNFAELLASVRDDMAGTEGTDHAGARGSAILRGNDLPTSSSGADTTPNPASSTGSTSTVGNGGTGGGGGTSISGGAGPVTFSGTERDGFQIPGGAELWQHPERGLLLMYRVPNTAVPMLWHIEDPEQLSAIFGPTGKQPDRQVTTQDLVEMGALFFGESRELANTSEHPFDQFLASYEMEAQIRPWLRDPEIMALTAQAILEGRTISDAELQTTDWWQSRSESERRWLSLNASDPATADALREDNRTRVAEMLQQSGVRNPPTSLIYTIADKWTTGDWSETFALNQIQLVANPAENGELADELQTILDNPGDGFGRAADDVTEARQMVTRWLGEYHAQGWSDDALREWGRRIKTSEAERLLFEDTLRGQRLALFPEYDNPDLTYDDIASPWRQTATSAWGQSIDESDPFFLKLVRTNDAVQADQMLRSEGMRRGIGAVVNRAVSDAASEFGGGQVLNSGV